MATNWERSTFKLTGVLPGLLLHNGRLADPLNFYSRELKKLTAKRKKTDADHEQMAKVEWIGGLYLDKDTRVILPTEGMEAVLCAGAKKSKDGMTVKSGVYCPEPSLLIYDGPKDIEELWADERFRLRVGVAVGQSTVMRTRPLFNEWSCLVTYCFNPTVVSSKEQIYQWLAVAGEVCGAFDWRPKYGRFTVAYDK